MLSASAAASPSFVMTALPRLLAVLLALAAAGCTPAGAGDHLHFSAIPDENTTELAAKFQPLATYLTQALGVPCEYVPLSSYAAAVEAFKNGDIDLAWFGGLTGAQARAAVPGARAIAQGRIDPEYKSYFIAHADTGLERSDTFPRALGELSFTFGSDLSTSGRLMPEYFIRQHTQSAPSEFFGTPNHYSGSHDKTAKLVQARTFEAGALGYKSYERLVAEGKLDPQRCRVIWETPSYADYNWSASPTLDARFGEGFTERLQRALIDLKNPELLAAVNRPEGLIAARNSDFERIAQLARELEFLE